jgi:protein SCO1/2
MKKLILSVALVAIVGMSFSACKNESKDSTTTDAVAITKYQCPMQCEGDKTYTDADVKCPVCGMGLTLSE